MAKQLTVVPVAHKNVYGKETKYVIVKGEKGEYPIQVGEKTYEAVKRLGEGKGLDETKEGGQN